MRHRSIRSPFPVLVIVMIAGLPACDSVAKRSLGDDNHRSDSAGFSTPSGDAIQTDRDNPVAAVMNQIGVGFPAQAQVRSVQQPTVQAPTVEELVRRLRQLNHGDRLTIDQTVDDLARLGDAAVEEIERQATEKPDFGMLHRSVRVLQVVNTERARALLRRIALGEIKPGTVSVEGWAAQALVACDENEVKALLSSNDADVLCAATKALWGRPLDPELMPLLGRHLNSSDPHTRYRVAHVMATEAPHGELAERALDGVSTTLAAIADVPDVDAIDEGSGLVNYEMTHGEWHYSQHMGLLVRSNVDNGALHELADKHQARARDTVLLALAFRGDTSVREEIVELAQDPNAGLFRASAARALGAIGTPNEIPLLQSLKESDPLKRDGGGCIPPLREDSLRGYPVREAAQQAIKKLERANSEESQGALIDRDDGVFLTGIAVVLTIGALASWLVISFLRRYPTSPTRQRRLYRQSA